MGVKKYTINVEEHITGGAKCSKPSIVWDDPKCAGIVCEKNNGRTIKVAIPDDCTDRCFYVTYSCADPCNDDCDPVRLRICPCDVAGDCPDGCSDCIDHICVSRCDEGEFCNDADICVECDDENPCPNGKVCVNGECVCPPSKPFLDSKGNCVPCTADSCPEGQKCTPEGCMPIDCPEGVWHPTKKKCVECLNTGHCGLNECCNEDNECECCTGFVRDFNTGECVPGPICETDDECPDCTYCDGVTCVPINCGPGKVCIPGEGCVPECNCDDPDCDDGAACVTYSADICYCKKCTGNCAEGCSEGCICDENDPNGGCIPNPCANVSCEDGSECGEGCGCNPDTKKCEPCSSAECGDECDHLLGCHCPNGTSCQDVKGCDGPCDGYGDCPNGCTCVEGQCVPCADFSCDNDDCENHPECGCNGGNCEGDSDFCEDEFTTDDFDCGVSAELKLADGCMCPAITAYTFPYEVTKVSGAKFQYNVKLAIRLAKGFAADWPSVGGLHILDQTQFPDIADNDTPTSGTVNLQIREYYQPQIWQNNGWVNQGPITYRILPASSSFSFAGIARKEGISFTAHGINTPKNVLTQVSQERVVRYEIDVDTKTLKFPNGCDYEAQELDVLRLDSVFKTITDALDASTQQTFYDTTFYSTGGNYNIGLILSQWESFGSASSRKPLFTWYRSEDDVYTDSDIIRKLYIGADSAGRYEDVLHGPAKFDPKKENLEDPEGRVFGNMYYKVTNDCGCDDRELDLGKKTWCSPESLVLGNIVFSNCNKKVEIKSDIGRPCVTNRYLQELSLHQSDNTTAFKNAHQAYYHLVIELADGTSVDIPYVWREQGLQGAGLYRVPKSSTNPIEPIKQFIQTFNSEVVAMRIELKYGASDEIVCQWDKTIPVAATHTPTYTTNCQSSGKVAYRFNLAVNNITNITAVGGTVSSGSGYKEVTATQGQEVTVYIEFTTYCPLTMKLNKNCCETLTVDTMRTDVENTTELTSTVVGGVGPHSVRYYRQVENEDPELVGESTDSSTAFKVILTDALPGLYYGEVEDVNECIQTSPLVSVDPRDPEDYLVTVTPAFTGCTYTGNVSFAIPNQADLLGGKVNYKVNAGATQSFTITSLMISSGQHLLPSTGNTVSLVSVEVPNTVGPNTVFPLTGSATVPSNLNADVPGVTAFTINGVATSISICAGEEVLLELQGTPNAVVEFNTIPAMALDGSGYGSLIQTPTASTTYQITSVKNSTGSCVGTQGVGLTRAVAASPQPSVSIVTDVCDSTLTFRTVTFNNITSATDQLGNVLTVTANAVTVNPSQVTAIHVLYNNGICTVSYIHPVTSCDCPEIKGTLSAPSSICEETPFTLTVSGVTGGTGPYSYNYYSNTEFNDTYVLNQSSKVFAPTATDTYHVRIKDANGCISSLGNVTVQVVADPIPNIVPLESQTGITEVSDNVFEIDDNLTSAIFKTQENYTSVAWLVTGSYGGSTSGSGATFTLDVAQISGAIVLKVTATNATGCTGIEEVTITKVTPEALLEDDEILFSTAGNRLFRVQITPTSIGVPVQLCGPGQTVKSIAMRGNGDLIGATGNGLVYRVNANNCSSEFLGTLWHHSSLGMLSADVAIAFGETAATTLKNRFSTFDLTTNTANNNYYTISDGVNDYESEGDIVRIGNYLYVLVRHYASGVLQNKVLLRATLNGSDMITGITNLGALPVVAGNPYGLAYLDGVAYLIYSNGMVYNLDLTTPGSSTFIGTIVVPGGEPIFDATQNF